LALNKAKLLSIVASDPKRKSYLRIFFENVAWMIRERELPQHYFSLLLYRKGNDPSHFIGRKRCWKIRRQYFYRGIEHSLSYLENKHLFWVHLKSTDIPIIDLAAHSTQNAIFDTRKAEIYKLCRPADITASLQAIGTAHGTDDLFAKPVFGLQGNACILFRQGVPVNQSMEAVYALLRRYPYIIQPRIDQVPALEAVNTSSVNTIRLNVFSEKGQPPRILTPFAKFGAGGAVVDNAGSGGLILPLNLQTGRASGPAFRFLKQGGATYSRHPDTQYPFDDFEVPQFAEACSVALRASEFFPHRFIGWDVAITSNGPVIVEGNSGPNLDCIQTLEGGFRNHPQYSKIFERFI